MRIMVVILVLGLGLLRFVLGWSGGKILRRRIFGLVGGRPGLAEEDDPVEILRVSLLEVMDTCFLAAGLFFLLLRPFVIQAFYLHSGSMEPTLQGTGPGPQDHILVNKFIYRFRAPQRRDILVFTAPQPELDECPQCRGLIQPRRAGGRNSWICNNPHCGHREPVVFQKRVKRLIGLPHETVELREGTVYVTPRGGYRERLQEPYLAPWPLYVEGQYRVPEGHYLVLGDNRNNSHDSRTWGPLPRERILGKAILIFWPLHRIRWLP